MYGEEYFMGHLDEYLGGDADGAGTIHGENSGDGYGDGDGEGDGEGEGWGSADGWGYGTGHGKADDSRHWGAGFADGGYGGGGLK